MHVVLTYYVKKNSLYSLLVFMYIILYSIHYLSLMENSESFLNFEHSKYKYGYEYNIILNKKNCKFFKISFV